MNAKAAPARQRMKTKTAKASLPNRTREEEESEVDEVEEVATHPGGRDSLTGHFPTGNLSLDEDNWHISK